MTRVITYSFAPEGIAPPEPLPAEGWSTSQSWETLPHSAKRDIALGLQEWAKHTDLIFAETTDRHSPADEALPGNYHIRLFLAPCDRSIFARMKAFPLIDAAPPLESWLSDTLVWFNSNQPMMSAPDSQSSNRRKGLAMNQAGRNMGLDVMAVGNHVMRPQPPQPLIVLRSQKLVLEDIFGEVQTIPELYSGAVGYVGLFYRYLNRPPDALGLKLYVTKDAIDVAAAIIQSPEYRHAFPAMSHTGFVTQTYQCLCGRDPTPAEFDAGTLALETGTSREQFAVDISETEDAQDFILAFYPSGWWAAI